MSQAIRPRPLLPATAETPTVRFVPMSHILASVLEMNMFFVVAVFACLALAQRGQHSFSNVNRCDVGVHVLSKLAAYGILSFCFLCSSAILAYALKLVVEDDSEARKSHVIHRAVAVASTLALAAGCILFVLSLVAVIEIRYGKFSCGIGIGNHIATALQVIAFTGLSALVLGTLRALF